MKRYVLCVLIAGMALALPDAAFCGFASGGLGGHGLSGSKAMTEEELQQAVVARINAGEAAGEVVYEYIDGGYGPKPVIASAVLAEGKLTGIIRAALAAGVPASECGDICEYAGADPDLVSIIIAVTQGGLEAEGKAYDDETVAAEGETLYPAPAHGGGAKGRCTR